VTDADPFAVLLAIAERSHAHALELPPKENAQTHWNGLGFSLLGQRFVAPMGEIGELMQVPLATRLPGVKHFVNGIANVRGRLMAILDLAIYFGTPSPRPLPQRRIFAVESGEVYLGFIVDESLGMQQFPQETFREEVEVADMFKPYVKGGYQVGGNHWPILSLTALAADDDFSQLAQ
jgi:twitching motility protein PilI